MEHVYPVDDLLQIRISSQKVGRTRNPQSNMAVPIVNTEQKVCIMLFFSHLGCFFVLLQCYICCFVGKLSHCIRLYGGMG